MSDLPLDAATIERYLSDVADELPQGEQPRVLTIVGGALLALHGLRAASRDVDSISRLDGELRAAVSRVAVRHAFSAASLFLAWDCSSAT